MNNRIAESLRILQLPFDTTTEEIKRTFRTKAKNMHPDLDVHTEGSDSAMKELIIAYRSLLEWKKQVDVPLKGRGEREKNKFNYREFLRSRTEDLYSQAKLIFYDLLNGHEDEAIDLYRSFFAVPDEDRDLEKYMDREDYMDCAFLLAEEFEKRKDMITAFNLLIRISELEYEAPYFKHFMEEVLLRLQQLVCLRMTEMLPEQLQVQYLHSVLGCTFARDIRSSVCKRLAELYAELSMMDEARYYLEMCLLYQPKMSGIKSLKKRILCS